MTKSTETSNLFYRLNLGRMKNNEWNAYEKEAVI